jgi:hypothetical protein
VRRCTFLLMVHVAVVLVLTTRISAQSTGNTTLSNSAFNSPLPNLGSIGGGSLSGSFQSDVQWYLQDSSIGATPAPEQILSNSALQLWWNSGRFTAGVRYEAYLNPLQGFDPRWRGNGIAFRSLSYNGDFFEVTAGNFYEQFGVGLILRGYEERQLGIDNVFDGIRVKLFPVRGLAITTMLAKHRFFWASSEGVLRGADVQCNLAEVLPSLAANSVQLDIGLSGVSRYQIADNPLLPLPQNTSSLEGRISLGVQGFSLLAAGAFRSTDPSSANANTYNTGNAEYINISYSQRGFAVNVSAKRIDNMDIRSDRTATGNVLALSFLPALTAQHSYRLAAFYPYATQANGEIGLQADVTYQFPRGSAFGGEYGATLTLNYARIHALDTLRSSEYTYQAGLAGQRLFFQDINLEFLKKWSSQLYTTLQILHIDYDKDQIAGVRGVGLVSANIIALDATYTIDKRNTFRFEAQHLGTPQDEGSWAFALAEYTLDQEWYFTLFDEYNYGNPNAAKQLHYLSGSVSYRNQGFRAGLSFGRQRAGILCVGGLCRVVPASNGISFSINATF